ncbi:rho guanine nucleotide exchange factor 18 isoform X2 [Rana temporaria]|uniref:rho guanine nucleotide exchange factor 18 isoform X2 n=1 Tax=Rana temporaria TaxID=8407 RepID=UPI001AADDE7A|nr:rho guanine nucleotide exchange factor 18 isoform X2 [Rana temporaria]
MRSLCKVTDRTHNPQRTQPSPSFRSYLQVKETKATPRANVGTPPCPAAEVPLLTTSASRGSSQVESSRCPRRQRTDCAVNVHKNCKTLLPECTGSKSKKDSFYKPATSSHVYSFYQQASLKDPHRIAIVGLDGAHTQGRGPGMTVTNRGNSRVEIQATAGSRTGSVAADMDELDSNFSKLKIFTEDNVSLAPSSTESLFVEEAFYSSVRSELEADAVELETESWSSAVEPPFAKKQKKEVIKRQDVIYELMQTEMHHVRTLKIMLKVYCRALKEELHWNNEIHQLLPCLDELLELHGQFLTRFKERRKESLEEGSDRNYIIQKIGDILVQQFSGDTAARMKDKYGVFCSQHNRAVSRYKFLMRENKKFQNLMKKIGNSSIVRRLGVPECILLVTQRITKYPVLVERIIQNTEEGTEDYEALTQALTLLKETITEVDLRVHRSEKGQRLSEIIAKMEPKSSVKLKNGMTFRKHNMENRQLLLDGMLYWKSASGRLKDILAVLLTDVLLLLQEKDQKYMFSSLDAKPPVISLQKLIVREVANEEKAMFLISASLKGPEMYEIHTASKEERNTWMTLIRGAVESCPDEEEITNEADIERRQAYERAARIKDYEERLNLKDTYIMQTLSEKLQLYIDMADIYGFDDSSQGSKMRLFIGSDSADSLQGESTLLAAIAEAEKIHSMLFLSFNPHEDTSIGVCALPRRSETFGGYDSSGHSKSGSFKQGVKERRTTSTSSESHIQDLVDSESEMPVLENNNPSTSQESELIGKMQILLQLLYSLQAVVAQQDTYFEVQREREKQLRQQSSRGNWLLEQEKQRNFEKQREELANVQKQQEQLKQEKQRWERERTKYQKEMEADEMRLRQREETSQMEKEKLDQERSDLEKQRQAYQHDLERLREAQRAVEKDRERLEQLKKIKKTSVGAGSFAPDVVQVTLGVPHSASFNGEGMQSLEGASQLMKPLTKTSASVSAADYLERPEVMRRDSSSTDTRPALKNDVPVHLLSTTNQLQRPTVPTKQQIPTKLAALSKSGKEKTGRGKPSHRTDSSASIDHRALFPCRLSGKDESTVRSRRSASPSLTNSLISFFPQDSSGQGDPINETPPYHSSVHRQSSSHLLTPSIHPPPPPAPANEEDTNKEDVIFF